MNWLEISEIFRNYGLLIGGAFGYAAANPTGLNPFRSTQAAPPTQAAAVVTQAAAPATQAAAPVTQAAPATQAAAPVTQG